MAVEEQASAAVKASSEEEGDGSQLETEQAQEVNQKVEAGNQMEEVSLEQAEEPRHESTEV
mgnify:FL=1